MKTSVLSTFATAMTTIINKIQTAGKKAKTKRNSTKKRELYKDQTQTQVGVFSKNEKSSKTGECIVVC